MELFVMEVMVLVVVVVVYFGKGVYLYFFNMVECLLWGMIGYQVLDLFMMVK